MAQSYLIFDFGGNESAAQAARHKLESWRQAFRLDRKLQFKFERTSPEKTNGGEKIAIHVRLDFSDHERLSRQRWLERIPTEEPFHTVPANVLQRGDDGFDEEASRFDNLE
ncbi:MAG TPA: hypothetical protein VNL38_00545 [Candidatus Nitrosotenuis sp.]|nr:hypothetical protein [Candidatus Nitrosotenuis sp.]